MRSRYYSIMNDTPENVAEWLKGVAAGCFLLLWATGRFTGSLTRLDADLESGKTAKPAYLAALKESSAGPRGWRPAGLAPAGARADMRRRAREGGCVLEDDRLNRQPKSEMICMLRPKAA
jgi:hypothetical protein